MDRTRRPIKPVIVRGVRKKNHTHHNNAWKVAYADFVTAMMAFFLLLWLYSVTTPTQKKDIADYFTPGSGMGGAEGVGFQDGKNASSEIGRSHGQLTALALLSGQQKQGEEPLPPVMAIPDHIDPDTDGTWISTHPGFGSAAGPYGTDQYQIQAVAENLKQALEKDPDMQELKQSVVFQDTPEGLKIEMIDLPQNPLFINHGFALTEHGKKMFAAMARLILLTPNDLVITGHTSAISSAGGDNWSVSTGRANEVRRLLMGTSLDPHRIRKVVGEADRELLTPQEPDNTRNNRVTLTLMRGAYPHTQVVPAEKKPPAVIFQGPSLVD